MKDHQPQIIKGKPSSLFNPEEEEINSLSNGKLRIIQKKKGYRYNLDSFILVGFLEKACQMLDISPPPIIDIGCGCGIMAFLLSTRYSRAKIYGVELQEALADIAERTALLNSISKRVFIKKGDIRKVDKIFFRGIFNTAISNPPFYPIGRGRLNLVKGKAQARHELTLKASELLDSATYLLKSEGALILTYPIERYEELLPLFVRKGFFPELVRFVKPFEESPPQTFLICLRKKSVQAMQTMASLVIYQEENCYSTEMAKLFKMFGVEK